MRYSLFALLLISSFSFAWLGGWDYRTPVNIYNSGSALYDYPVLINLTSLNFNFSKANSQGNDTRVTWLNTSSGLEQNISFWIENWTASGSLGNATIWVNVPNVTASTVANTTLYMYYGNPGVASASMTPEKTAALINTAINDGTKTVAQIALELMGLTPAYAASIFNSNNLTVANAALIFNNAELTAAKAALIFNNANIAAAKANSILAHANLASNREQAILYQMVTNNDIAKLMDIVTVTASGVTYSANTAITGTMIYRNLTVNTGVTLTANTLAERNSGVLIAYSITNNGTITRTAQGGAGGAYGEISYDSTTPASIYRIGTNSIGTGGNMNCLHYGAGGGANGVGSSYGGDGGPVTYTTKTSTELTTLSLNAVVDYFIRTVQSKSSPSAVQEFINVYGAGGGSGYRAAGGNGGGGLLIISKTIDNNFVVLHNCQSLTIMM